jgi:hypothetical protein
METLYLGRYLILLETGLGSLGCELTSSQEKRKLLVKTELLLICRDLQGTSMEGPIPASISNLKNLTELRITDLRGPTSPFPDLQNMTNMERLVLRNCLIREPIPEYIGTSMTMLKLLDLSSNMLNGTIPDTFRSLNAFNFM